MRRKTPEEQRGAWGATHRAGRPWPAAPPGPAGGTRTCSWGTPSAPSDAYKIPKKPKNVGAAIIFQKLDPDMPSPKTLVWGPI